MKEQLTPEEILAKVAQTRKQQEIDLVDTLDDVVQQGDEETPDPKRRQSRLNYTNSIDPSSCTEQSSDLEDLEAKEAAVAPTMQRSVRYTPAGAFPVRGRENRSVVSSVDGPPMISAVLVDGNSSRDENTQSIYTAEPMMSEMSSKEAFWGWKRRNLMLFFVCTLGMLTIISLAVYFSIEKYASSTDTRTQSETAGFADTTQSGAETQADTTMQPETTITTQPETTITTQPETTITTQPETTITTQPETTTQPDTLSSNGMWESDSDDDDDGNEVGDVDGDG